MRPGNLFLPLAFLLQAPAALPAEGARVGSLRCEYLENPLGIDVARPRLFWRMESERRGERQTAYRVLVASSPERLAAGEGDLWDSGRVESDRSIQVAYEGRPLRSTQAAWWKVQAWDRDSRPTGWSPPASFEMGLLEKGDWHGKWIARTAETAYSPAPLLRREFEVSGKVKRARIYICGLGYHELRLNGEKVGDHVLDPGYTRYDRRVLYVTHDVTDRLKQGKNALGAILGTGWFNVHTLAVWHFDKAPWRAAPKLLLEMRLEYEGGRVETIASDGSWKTSTGPIVFESIYGGETYDARLEKAGWDSPGFDDSGWESAKVVDAPKGVLRAQMMPPIKVSDTIEPAKVAEPKPGAFVYDIGQNLAGFAHLTISGPAGTRVVMKYGERLAPDGTLDQSNIAQHQVKTTPPQPFQTDTYILKGTGEETWEARFVYHGFQYVEVTGAPGKLGPQNLRGRFIHSAVPPAGRFECSDPLLNRIQRCTLWAYLSNLQGIPTDCPHREKNGWTGDAHLAAEQAMYNFFPPSVYTKWIGDLADEQKPTGELPGIVPTGGWGYDWGNGPAWDSAFLLIPWYMYLYYGDRRILEEHYEGFRRYVDYLTRKADKGIVSIGLGDWVPYKTETPVPVTSTGYYYRDLLIVSQTARFLGKEEEARRYSDLAESARKAFNEKFFDEKTGLYANGSQTALSCALYQGLVEPRSRDVVLKNLVVNIERCQDHIDTGILGAKYVLNALLEGGRVDVAYRIVSQKTLPGWGHWIDQGATTLWESWGGGDSRNHIMFGDVSAWLYKALAGIDGDPSSPGFKRISIKPQVVGDLTFARGEYESIHGKIASAWRIEDGKLKLEVAIPANTTAVVHIPAKEKDQVTEGGRAAEGVEGVKFLRMEEGRAVFEVGSGSYRFEAPRS